MLAQRLSMSTVGGYELLRARDDFYYRRSSVDTIPGWDRLRRTCSLYP